MIMEGCTNLCLLMVPLKNCQKHNQDIWRIFIKDLIANAIKKVTECIFHVILPIPIKIYLLRLTYNIFQISKLCQVFSKYKHWIFVWKMPLLWLMLKRFLKITTCLFFSYFLKNSNFTESNVYTYMR